MENLERAGNQYRKEIGFFQKKEIPPRPAVCWCFSSLQPTPHPHSTGFLIIGNVMTNQGMTYKSLCFLFHYVCAYQDRFQRGLWLPWHTPPLRAQFLTQCESRKITMRSKYIALNIPPGKCQPDKAFPPERK